MSAVGRRDRDRQRGLRPHAQSVWADAHAGRQQRRRGAIIAAQGSPCGLGTDSGASVRLPAHFCGLASIKPSAGRVPLTGVVDDDGQVGTLGDPRTQVGPLARSVADVALVLSLMAGPDGRDGGVVPVALGDPDTVEMRGVRVAVQTENDLAAPTAETVATVERAASALRAAGATVEDTRHPGGGHELTIEVWRPTAAASAPTSSGGCCGAGTRSVARCSRSRIATTSSSAPCSRARLARTAR